MHDTDVAKSAARQWRQPPFLLEWSSRRSLNCSTVKDIPNNSAEGESPPWIDSGPADQPFDFCIATSELVADICLHSPELRHIRPRQLLITILQARSIRSSGLQARITPLRFPGGHLVRHHRGRLYQIQRIVVDGEDMLYVLTFCLPRFLNQTFDEKMITIFHELHHIGPNFDGDLRRHRGRYRMHTASQSRYDANMASHARAYLSSGANARLHGFLRLSFAQLVQRHGRIIGIKIPRPKILPLPNGELCPAS